MPKIVDHGERRDSIAAIAAQLIARGGLDAATIREIARLSGHSKGIVEHYFENKQDLISAALEWANARYTRRAERATAGKAGLSALRERIRSTLPLNAEIREEWKIRLVFWSIASLDEGLRRQQAQRFTAARRHLASDLKQAMAAGEIAHHNDSNALAERLLHQVSGLSCAALHNPTHYSPRRLETEIGIMLQSLQPCQAQEENDHGYTVQKR